MSDATDALRALADDDGSWSEAYNGELIIELKSALREAADDLAAAQAVIEQERTKYRELLAAGETGRRERRRREAKIRDEARASAQSSSSALATHDAAMLNTLQEADNALGDPEHPRWDTKSGEARRRLYKAIQIITRDEDARNAELDAHDAEVAAKALDDAAEDSIRFGWGGLRRSSIEAWLRDRAQALRGGQDEQAGDNG